MESNPSIRICTEHASCNCCHAANYKHSQPSARFGQVDKIFEIRIGNMVNRVCPDCLRKLAITAIALVDGVATYSSVDAPILIHIRDCNGRRDIVECRNSAEVNHWATEEMSDEDEILMITQGNWTIYSSLQELDRTKRRWMALRATDLTGFFG